MFSGREARIAIRTMEDVFREATPEQIADGVLLSERVGEHCTYRFSIPFADHQLPRVRRRHQQGKMIIASSMPLCSCRKNILNGLWCW